MRWVDAVKNIDTTDQGLLESILDCVQDRLDWLEEREPESDGMVYDEWDEKHSEWEEIVETAEELAESENEKEKMELAGELREKIEDFQMMYKGISRLVI